MRVILGVSGASGSIYAWRLLEKIRHSKAAETHLILSRAAEKTAVIEIKKSAKDFKQLSDYFYPIDDIGATPASGSFPFDAMIVAPCSVHTMSAIAHGITSNLLTRAADVTLKERRRLVLMVRETPFHIGHLRTMVALSEMGAIVAPPIPAFYTQPATVAELVDHSVDRVLDLIGLPSPQARRWEGTPRFK